ncbi:MAG: HAD family phosphatase [Chloroflexi bacterium]|nr:MAG: HAD family phosphatase [Chloroflexota bacterium]
MNDKTIIFDLGGVLLDWNPRYLYGTVFSGNEEMEYFLEEICSPAWNAQMDADKTFQEGIEELLPKHPAYADQIRMYQTHWSEMLRGEFPDSVAVLRELKEAGCRLAALSNWSGETFPQVKDQYGFLEWFEVLVLSGEVGVAKPDPLIFQILLRELGRTAEECIFIDDMPENIAEAARQGFDAIHFDSAENLRIDLSGKGQL